MNKNKIILAIIGGLLLASLLWLATILNSSTKNTDATAPSSIFTIWTLGNEGSQLGDRITYFKESNPKYKNTSIKVENFTSYEEYYYALISAITKGKSPDIFMLNNNEKTSVFEDQILGIDPTIVNPSDFRKKYKGVFADDLITTYTDNITGIDTEFLKGIPVGYETLGIFYDRRYVRASDLNSIASLNNIITKLHDSQPNIIPLGIGNGSTVSFAADIITQFFMLESEVTSLADLVGTKSRQALTAYLFYGDEAGTNQYNSRFSELDSMGKDNIYAFSRGDVRMFVGYPQSIHNISDTGYSQKNLLQVAPFPHYFSGNGKTLINYNYFVVNKDSENTELADLILQNLTSDKGASKYLETYKYYLPALLSLESDAFGNKIDSDFSIVLGDFYNPNYELSSFDKGIKTIYDTEVISILDNTSNYLNLFEEFRRKLECKTNKVVNLINLGTACK